MFFFLPSQLVLKFIIYNIRVHPQYNSSLFLPDSYVNLYNLHWKTMQHTLQQAVVDDNKKSAFHAVEQGKSPGAFVHTTEHKDKRDSGYGTTDNSPATIVPKKRFTFDKDEFGDKSSPETLGDMINALPKDFKTMELEENVSDISDSSVFSYETDDDNVSIEDKEVQELLQGNSNPVSIPMASSNVRRPSAPIPTPEEDYVSHTSYNSGFIPITWSINRPGPRARNRPTVSRGTQTPSPHCQVIRDLLRDRYHPYIARGKFLVI